MTCRASLLLSLALAGPALADTAVTCTKVESGRFAAAVARAETLTIRATAAIGPNRTFTRWFGPHTPKSGEAVRQNLKAIAAALRSGQVQGICRNAGEDLCDGDTFAFVDKEEPLTVNLCPNFFAMDTFKQLSDVTVADGTGTRAGTLIHEISHFTVVADTEDHCYSRRACAAMALSAPGDALTNADSYQYFVEDVTYFDEGKTD